MEEVKPTKELSSSNRILVWIGIVVVVAIVVAAVLNGSSVKMYGADTPEGVVQRYVNAVLDGDETTAGQYLAPGVAAECDGDEFYIRYRYDESTRVSLLKAFVLNDSSATVEIRVTEGSYGLLDSYEYDHEELLELERYESGWLISRQTWPRYGC